MSERAVLFSWLQYQYWNSCADSLRPKGLHICRLRAQSDRARFDRELYWRHRKIHRLWSLIKLLYIFISYEQEWNWEWIAVRRLTCRIIQDRDRIVDFFLYQLFSTKFIYFNANRKMWPQLINYIKKLRMDEIYSVNQCSSMYYSIKLSANAEIIES